jgi:hypothetical protein
MDEHSSLIIKLLNYGQKYFVTLDSNHFILELCCRLKEANVTKYFCP